jgi:hypothetical protein
MVDESETDIYSVWEKENSEVMDNYEHTKGELPVKLVKTNWI